MARRLWAPLNLDVSQSWVAMLLSYRPEIAPDPSEWLSIDESERIRLVEAYHAAEGTDLPNERVHAAIHVIIENQIAGNVEAVVEAAERLTTKDGLSRHDTLHAIGAVVAEHLFSVTKGDMSKGAGDVYDRYLAAVRRITAKRWRQLYGVPPARRAGRREDARRAGGRRRGT